MIPFACEAAKRIRYLNADIENLIYLQRLAAYPLLQAHALQLFHDNEGMSRVVIDIVDGADARMVQLRSRTRLAHKAVERLAVVHHLLWNKLQRDMARQARVFRLIHHAHATAAELPHYVIVGDCLADHS